MAVASAGLVANESESYAQSSASAAEGLAPIVYIVLDTSGSMNSAFAGNNNTRLTKALGELVGGSQNYSSGNLVRATVDSSEKTVMLPFPEWKCSGGTCSFTFSAKGVPQNSEIAKPKTNYTTSTNIGTFEAANYYDDGVIQTYKKFIKFGFAGFAVGSTGSSAGKDSPLKQAAAIAGGRVDGVLRYTMVWNDIASKPTNNDWDAHCQCTEYTSSRGGYTNTHIYYGNKNGCGNGKLDVDIITPNSSGVTLSGYTQKLGIENIAWPNTDYMRKDDTFKFTMTPFSCSGNRTGNGGFKAEVAFPTSDANSTGCTDTFTVEHTGSVESCGSSLTIPVMTVTYDGNGTFHATRDSSYTMAKDDSAHGQPTNIYGFKTYLVDGVTYGRNLTASTYTYKHTRDCTFDLGMWDNQKDAYAPLTYPSVDDSNDSIENHNNALIRRVRSYVANSATPIGETLADLYYMFGADSENFSTVDQGLVKERNSTNSGYYTDEYYACRPKAVVLISDGGPNGSGLAGTDDAQPNLHGHSKQVWHDAKHLYDRGIKVYTVGYAEFNIADINDPNSDVSTLNKLAWKGGTCRDPATSKIIDPTSDAAYNTLIASTYDSSYPADKVGKTKPNADKICFYNASDSTALRAALVNALSDMLKGVYSKTKIATTTGIGFNRNSSSSGSGIKFNTGYYNVYSGYAVSLAPIRKTKLERETTICDNSNGEFKNEINQYLNLAHRLKCRLTSCDVWRAATAEEAAGTTKIEGMIYNFTDDTAYTDAGYTSGSTPAPCAPLSPAIDSAKDNTNTCLSKRYIFSGDYVSSPSKDGTTGAPSRDRYAISTFPTSFDVDHPEAINHLSIKKGEEAPSIMKVAALKGANFGIIPSSKVVSNTVSDYNYVNHNSESACNTALNASIEINAGTPNYMISPYECKEDMDCGMDGGRIRLCDAGRCISPDQYASRNQTCVNGSTVLNGENVICINGRYRKKGTECSTHAQCAVAGKCSSEGTCVCHAGQCVAGTVIASDGQTSFACDTKQFLASQTLGTIEYASPLPVPPPSRPYFSSDYRRFTARYWQRDTMLMVAANDGMLHAFILGDNTTTTAPASKQLYPTQNYATGVSVPGLESGVTNTIYKITDMPDYGSESLVNINNKEGDELWAFVPKLMLPKVKNLINYGAQSFVNTSPVVSDVKLPGITINGDSWRTVLVGGYRDGGRGYYALDITDPAHPIVLWEIDNTWKYKSSVKDVDLATSPSLDVINSSNDTDYPFQLMGYSYPQPVIANMEINGIVEPVAVLAGGNFSNDDSHVGKALYVVRLFPKQKSDLLVKAFFFKNRISGAPTVYPNNFNAVAQHIYVGDEKGALYRLNVSNETGNPVLWGAQESQTVTVKHNNISRTFKAELPIFEPKTEKLLGEKEFSKITFAPAVSLYTKKDGRPVIQLAFGTGSNDDFNVNPSDRHYFASFIDIPDGTGYTLNKFNGVAGFTPEVIVLNTPDTLSNSTTLSSTNKYKVYATTDPTGAQMPPHQKLTGGAITHNFVSYFPTYNVSSSDNNCPVGNAVLWRVDNVAANVKHQLAKAEMTQNSGANVSDVFNSKSFVELPADTKIYGIETTSQLYCSKETEKGKLLAPQLVAQTGVSAGALSNSDSSLGQMAQNKAEVSALSIGLETIQPKLKRSIWANVYE